MFAALLVGGLVGAAVGASTPAHLEIAGSDATVRVHLGRAYDRIALSQNLLVGTRTTPRAVLGKPVGVLAGAWLVTRLTRAELNQDVSWRDLTGVAVLAGVGFTVALLVAELSFTGAQAEAAKTAVLAGSVVAAALAAVLLRRRSKVHAGH